MAKFWLFLVSHWKFQFETECKSLSITATVWIEFLLFVLCHNYSWGVCVCWFSFVDIMHKPTRIPLATFFWYWILMTHFRPITICVMKNFPNWISIGKYKIFTQKSYNKIKDGKFQDKLDNPKGIQFWSCFTFLVQLNVTNNGLDVHVRRLNQLVTKENE